MPATNLTRKLCERIVATRYESLDARTVFKVKEAVRDGFSVAIAGCRQEPVTILSDYVRSLGSAPVATVWGHGYKTSMASAAFVNAASEHVLDYEPMSSPSTHAVSPVLPGIMALAEAEGHGGREIIAACAKGIEMQQRLLYACTEPPRELQRFHQPGMVGVMGAAVAASHLLGLDLTQMCNAIGMAASRAGALLANAGTMTKCTHAGNSAASGLEVALLAKRGFDANPGILEDHKGYLAAFFTGGPFDYAKLLDYGKPFRIVEPGMAYKFFPSKFPTQFAITAALELHKQLGDVSKISRVVLTTPMMQDVNRPEPKSGLEGKFSFQYSTAVALLDGKMRIDSFSDERRFRSDIKALLPKIELNQSKDITDLFHKMHIVLAVETTDGRRYETECRKPKGFWGVDIPLEDHMEKMQDCMSSSLNAAQIDEIAKLTASFEALEQADVRRLLALLSGGKSS